MSITHNPTASIPKLCSIDGCTRPASARGWCRAHYAKWERYRDPLGGRKMEINSPLSEALNEVMDIFDLKKNELAVLSDDKDPYRLDTDSNHRNGKWLRKQMEACRLIWPDGTFDRKVHNRGAHYALVSKGGIIRPDNGQPYLNDDDGWEFLEKTSSVARWLQHVPFEAIFDARNSAPIIRLKESRSIWTPSTSVKGLDPELLDALEQVTFAPSISTGGQFQTPEQPYRLVFWGEKTSLETVLDPLAAQYDADLYLSAGEMSNTMGHTMAKTGAADGREMVVFVFADADPAGYHMATSIAHKLRAFRDSMFPNLRFRLVPACLTIEQVRELGLPSTPLKPTEKRGDRWRECFGVEQTEIDALATLQPDTLRRIVSERVAPYYDGTAKTRASRAFGLWWSKATGALEAALAKSDFAKERIKAEAEVKELIDVLQDRKAELEAIVKSLAPKLPPIEAVKIELDEPPAPFISSRMDLFDHIKALRKRKDYK